MSKKGYVYLVGAGPGDMRLITVKGLEVLKQAEVILYDRLVNPLLLQEANDDAELIYCGKLPDRHILRQEAINDLLVKKAEEGKVVVRLKGGDPGVFGRVGEEAKSLKDANIGYEIVPGITSGIAAASYAGIPVTHRDYGTSFTVVTGHDKSVDGKPLIDWNALATGIDTIAFYMGVKNLPYICEQLIVNGRSAETKVAVIQWGTTSKQKIVKGTLNTIEKIVREKQISNPAITLVGNIVELHEQLKWFEQQPLFRRKIIFPNSNSKLKNELMSYGAEVLTYPKVSVLSKTKEFSYISKLNDIQNYDELFFTSKASVSLFFNSLMVNHIDVRSINAELYCNDSDTAEALKEKGLLAKVVHEGSLLKECLIVGSDQELANANLNRFLVTHTNKPSFPAKVAFKRVLEEDRFNTIIFHSPKAIVDFLHYTKQDGHDGVEIISSCEVICLDEETSVFAKENNIVVDCILDRKVNNIVDKLAKIENRKFAGINQ